MAELADARDLPAGRQAQNPAADIHMYHVYIIKSKIRNYNYVGITNNPGNKFIPTLFEIDSAEIFLRKGIKEININRPNQFGNCPIIHKHLRKYLRQYFGRIENGEKIILINCLWANDFLIKNNGNWKKEEQIVMDGCSYYWSIKVNLNTKTLFDFKVNGPG